MKFVNLSFVVVLVVVTSVASDVKVENNKDSRIVGGQIADIGAFPFIVSLRYVEKDFHFCGGSIISKDTILTAAHCMTDVKKEEDMKVVTGSNYLRQGGDTYDVLRIIKHKLWWKYFTCNDIALLKLDGSIKYTETIQPIALNTDFGKAGETLTIIGWGRYDVDKQASSEELKYLTVHSLTTEICSIASRHTITKTQICVYAGKGKGACNGDSGGPLINAQGRLVGIASFVTNDCAGGKPDVYTRVFQYTDWILSNSVPDALSPSLMLIFATLLLSFV